MAIKTGSYLLIDIDNEFSRSFVKQYINTNDAAKKDIIIAGANTQKLVKMMFDELVKDYCYCDIENEISISELASYLHEHHNVQGVLFNQTDYLLADDKQRFIYNSLHEKRYIIIQTNHGYDIKPINEECHSNHLSCHTDIAQTAQELAELAAPESEK
tara:strand:+ start:1800 stop:2273 length:474 start_codon:yes stop_codon:yes gene_type:complete